MSGFSTIKVYTLANLVNQGQIAKLKPTKVKSPSKISTIKIICYLQNKCFVNLLCRISGFDWRVEHLAIC